MDTEFIGIRTKWGFKFLAQLLSLIVLFVFFSFLYLSQVYSFGFSTLDCTTLAMVCTRKHPLCVIQKFRLPIIVTVNHPPTNFPSWFANHLCSSVAPQISIYLFSSLLFSRSSASSLYASFVLHSRLYHPPPLSLPFSISLSRWMFVNAWTVRILFVDTWCLFISYILFQAWFPVVYSSFWLNCNISWYASRNSYAAKSVDVVSNHEVAGNVEKPKFCSVFVLFLFLFSPCCCRRRCCCCCCRCYGR